MVESGDSSEKKKLGETDCSDTGEQKRKAGKAKQQEGHDDIFGERVRLDKEAGRDTCE